MTELAEGIAAGGAYVDAGGLHVWYTERGQGPPLILLHGGLATGGMWSEPAVEDLARDYRVLLPDSRGHGRTANPAGTLAYGQMADDVAALAAALGLERPLVLGYSDGAQIALELGLRHPGLARAMVIGGVVISPSEAYLRMVGELGFPQRGKADLDEVERAMGDWWLTLRAAHHHAQGDDAFRAYLEAISELWYSVPDYTDAQLSSITEPALVIAGDRDDPSLDDSLRLYRLLPRGELAVVPKAGHGAGEKPIFWALVKDFLSRHSHPKATDA
ncbi:alpha/beta fold hydrolase [Longimicrobium sp.]|uniref:alpha/beta fold hydrolase n=1 Tax=Longimicrobium sp. TaxID=2029185 RepID=UPI003B3BD780